MASGNSVKALDDSGNDIEKTTVKEFAENAGELTDSVSGEFNGHGNSNELPEGYWKSYKFMGTMAATVLLAQTAFISYSIPVSILSVINQDIGPSGNITMVTLIHTMIKGVMLLVMGRLSDIFGRRWFIVIGQTVGTIGSLICALAPSVDVLIGGTVFLALGGCVALLYPLICQEIVPNKYRGPVQSLVTLSTFPFIGFGPTIGRSLVNSTELGWRWTYWINLIFCASSAILFFLCYFPPSFRQLQGRKPWRQQVKELDFLGFIVYGGSLVSMLLALVWSTGPSGWKSARVIAPLIVGFFGLVGFFIWEFHGPVKSPLLPKHLLQNRHYVASILVGVVAQMAFYSLNLFWPQIIAALFTKDNIKIGLMSSTTGSALAFGEIVCGFLIKTVGKTRWQMIGSAVALSVFLGLMSLITESRQTFGIIVTVFTGIFIGFIELLALVVCGLVVDPEDHGLAQGFFASFRNVGGTMANSIFVSINGNRIGPNLAKCVPEAATAAGLPASSVSSLMNAVKNGTAAALTAVPGINTTILAAVTDGTKQAYTITFRTVYLSSLVFAALAIASSWFVPNTEKYMTGFVAHKVDGSQSKQKDDKVDEETGKDN